MDFQEIRELIELFSKSDLDRLKIKREGFEFKLVRGRAGSVEVTSGASPAPQAAIQVAAAPEPVEDESLHYVTSPIVGTYYSAPNPKADAFVRVGSRVSSGQTSCIIEAMKLMNEIQCDVAGEVVSCLVENAQPVEFGQKLFAIKTS